MNERVVPAVAVGAAALAIGGLLLILRPEWGVGVVQWMLLSAVAAAMLYAFAALVPEGSVTGWWASPFDAPERAPRKAVQTGEALRIRERLGGRRVRLEGASPLPLETLRVLHPLIEATLVRAGRSPADEAQPGSAGSLLAPVTRAVLVSEPWSLRRRLWTARRDEGRAAEVVLRVLDDLERVEARAALPGKHPQSATNPESR